MRVLMLGRFSYSGKTRHILELAGELNRQGIQTVTVMTDCPAPVRERLRDHCRQKAAFIPENNWEQIARIARHYRVHLIHAHGPALLPQAGTLAQERGLPLGITVHEQPAPDRGIFSRAAFVITTDPSLAPLPGLARPAVFIPDGIDLAAYRPAAGENSFRITFIGETGGCSGEGYSALLKAAGLIDLQLDLICPEQPPRGGGHFHGWLPSPAGVLKHSQVVIGRRRALLEGMACGNAALAMGRSYGGMVEPGAGGALPFPDLSGGGAGEPCYRSIFYDLARLWKDREYLSGLQQRGRKFVRENCDLRLAAERTGRLYSKALSGEQ